jgi:hypothetical protein
VKIINNTITVTVFNTSASAVLRLHGGAEVTVTGNTLIAKKPDTFTSDPDTTGSSNSVLYMDQPVNAPYVYNIPADFMLADDNFKGNTLNGYNFDFYMRSPTDTTTQESAIANFSTASTVFFTGVTMNGGSIEL